MATDWIKVAGSTPDKPEVRKMARRLSMHKDEVLGKLVRMWLWFDANSVDGVVDAVVSHDIDDVVDHDGFASVCADVGWLEFDDETETLNLPNFDAHNGESAKKRALKARRQSNWRRKKDEQASTDVDAPPSSKTSTREEKRRSNTPISPNGSDEPETEPGKPYKNAVGIERFIADCKAGGCKPIPPDDAVFRYAADVGISKDFLRLCWLEFVERNQQSGKRYKDWRSAFRKCVRGNWFKLWYAGQEGGYQLTTVGIQAQRREDSRNADGAEAQEAAANA